MKKFIFFVIMFLMTFSLLSAQNVDTEVVFTEASDLTLVGQLLEDNTNPYHRVDTSHYQGFDCRAPLQVRYSSGLAVLFNTNSSFITVKSDFEYDNYDTGSTGIALRGYDLYIRKAGKWTYANARCPEDCKDPEENMELIDGMDDSMKECMIYFPMCAVLNSVQIGTEKGKVIEPGKSDFKYRIGIFGSSYTQGYGVSRAGMTYSMQFMRNTGFEVLNLGCGGSSKLQPAFAKVLADADLDALILDAFSNPDPDEIEARLFPFIETIQASHPDIPLIFTRTIYRRLRQFSQHIDHKEQWKMEVADAMMEKAMQKYENVYYVTPQLGIHEEEATVDGIHPTDMGYLEWAQSLEKPVLDILKKYGIYSPLLYDDDAAQEDELAASLKFTEASDLTLVGKILENTPNPYHRVDTCQYKGFSEGENMQIRCSAGLAVLFQTNSPVITVQSEYGTCYGYDFDGNSTTGLCLRGYDLYIKKDGKWRYANARGPRKLHPEEIVTLIDGMDSSLKECMIYLPIYCEMNSVRIGVEKGAVLEPLASPFHYRIGLFGSSYTQGIGASRAGMTYPSIFMRETGLEILNLGCAGNCELQPYFAEVLEDAEVDAFLFDAFSNPDPDQIERDLFPFIEKVQAAHPDIPLIFMKTIYREKRCFSQSADRSEQAKMEMAERMMKEAMKKYKNVYYIIPDTGKDSIESSTDGVHPSDMGYLAWARSIEKPVLKILKKYGMKLNQN